MAHRRPRAFSLQNGIVHVYDCAELTVAERLRFAAGGKWVGRGLVAIDDGTPVLGRLSEDEAKEHVHTPLIPTSIFLHCCVHRSYVISSGAMAVP
ncbi:hypothetical protein SCLCIDRAFT_1162918 [Scleroderma citrinum Foug A]|uniref:Uncharacterized protein n=1 Tax=Scleroderma citrinum Foug A TaxID=1036808 RepID=A0A0C3CVQ5_9AGAM|nr:hypothetical protein SCLCIDRAFT_1162918 [Scleroderma citrinum Foug A]